MPSSFCSLESFYLHCIWSTQHPGIVLTAAVCTGREQLRRESDWAQLQAVNMRWSCSGAQLFVQFEEGSISIFTFYAPSSRRKSRSRPSGGRSAKQRLLSTALAAISLPPPDRQD